MSCLTCQHTLHHIAVREDGSRNFWCPRCGTIKSETGEGSELFEAPRWLRLFLEGDHEGLRLEMTEARKMYELAKANRRRYSVTNSGE